jgi:hypothetical protein
MVGCFSCWGSFGSREGEAAGFSKVKVKVLKDVSNWGMFYNFESNYKKIIQADSQFVVGPKG